MKSIALIAKLTFTEFRRNRWLLTIGGIFTLLIIGLSLTGGSSIEGVAGFERLAASVLNIVLLFIPLVGFLLGAQLIAGDRESGALVYLLSQPIRKHEIFFGRALGAFAVLAVALSFGFGLSALFIALKNFEGIDSYFTLWALSLLFSMLCIGIGLFISAFSINRTKALGFALFGWLIFTFLSDLGLMGTSYVLNLETNELVALTLLNPLQSFKVLVIRLIASNLEVLGAGGMYFDMMLGKEMIPLLTGWLVFLTLFFLGGGLWVFIRQEES